MGNLFDFHAPFRGSHEHQLAGYPVQHHAKIQLLFNRKRFLHQQTLNQASFRPGLVSYQNHAENLLGNLDGLVKILRYLDPAPFAASAGVDLRFDYYAAAQFLRHIFRFGDRERNLPARHRDVVLGQEGLGLILVNFHG